MGSDLVKTSEPPGSNPAFLHHGQREIWSLLLCLQTQGSQLKSGGEGGASCLALLLRRSEGLLGSTAPHPVVGLLTGVPTAGASGRAPRALVVTRVR